MTSTRIVFFVSFLLALYACAGTQSAMDPPAVSPSMAPAPATTPAPAASTHGRRSEP